MAIFIKLGDIKGNVTAKGFEDQIQLEGLQFGVGRAISMETGNMSNREAGRPSLSEVTVSKSMDAASAKLLEAALTGDAGVSAVITVAQTGAKQVEEFCKYELENVLISSYSVSAGADSKPVESLSMSYSKMTHSVTGADATNKNGTNIKVGYDLAAGSPL